MRNRLLSLPIQLAHDGGEPYKQQIARAIEQLIVAGRLQAGDQLPSISELMAMLKVSKNTVLAAYELLHSAGLIHSRPRGGFFVEAGGACLAKPAELAFMPPLPPPVYAGAARPARAPGVHALPPAAPVRFDFKVGRPSPHAFPWQRWATLSSQLLRHAGCAIGEYPPAEGLWGLRMQLADYLASAKALAVEPEQIVIVAGSQEALSLLVANCLDDGAEAVMETPGYTGFSHLLAQHRARSVPIPVDAEGLRTELLPERALPLAYVTPSHQYPLGHTLSLARRRQLLEWAARNGTLIVEDDYDGDFRYESVPLPPLMAMDPSRVVYLGTFSKALGPGLRLGYMVCPPALVDDIARRKALLNNACPWLEQAVMARYLESGEYSRHLHGLRKRYRSQRDALLDGLHGIWQSAGRVGGDKAGMHIAFHLPGNGPCAAEVAQRALACGVRLYTLSEAASGDGSAGHDHTLLFGYAALGTDEIGQAMQRLSAALN
ncbi:PLP-dependent aminotransferase family protein [Pseudothauera nasutitermitis]|uniref:PLP-dependent aminotransferase family protein n=1 Tax=Pseudothauera nasutitermitis TaxID=2565930 RepID=A0A4V3WC33_9RHOO|nr:PLP-dependent aminotransferase family protein [Pseudothauera nasutitermitis]THF65605.1 PLP-dependent aminotransferase family protein [Pseudothauera nasutitermitis]